MDNKYYNVGYIIICHDFMINIDFAYVIDNQISDSGI